MTALKYWLGRIVADGRPWVTGAPDDGANGRIGMLGAGGKPTAVVRLGADGAAAEGTGTVARGTAGDGCTLPVAPTVALGVCT